MALAEAGIECYRHSRPAVLVCVRCQAPYCNKCRAKPFRGQFYCCKRCQAGVHNRRFGALLVDAAIFNYLPILMVVPFIGSQAGVSLTYLAQGAGGILFLIRDAMFRGAGPGKRVTSLRVVQVQDGVTPLTYGQGVIRWLSQLIPIFNLIDAFAPARDPLQRRYGDRWAKTRVIDTARKLEKDREKAKHRMAKKGIELVLQSGMTMEQFARIAE
jgi:uncharacterized RDD family membrane protein YckC